MEEATKKRNHHTIHKECIKRVFFLITCRQTDDRKTERQTNRQKRERDLIFNLYSGEHASADIVGTHNRRFNVF